MLQDVNVFIENDVRLKQSCGITGTLYVWEDGSPAAPPFLQPLPRACVFVWVLGSAQNIQISLTCMHSLLFTESEAFIIHNNTCTRGHFWGAFQFLVITVMLQRLL